MRTTIDLSDELYRRVKATAAMRGRKFKDLVEEALRGWLAATGSGRGEEAAPEPSFDEMMRDCRGIAEDVPPDFATNPRYMEGLGR